CGHKKWLWARGLWNPPDTDLTGVPKYPGQHTPAYFSKSVIPNSPFALASPGRQSGEFRKDVGSWRRSSKITSATSLPPTSPRCSPLRWTSASASTYSHKGVSDQVAEVLSSVAVHGVRPRTRAMASPDGNATECPR